MCADVVYDIMGSGDSGSVLVTARIRMLSEGEGGRSSPFYPNYRPNHNFGDPTNRGMYIGQVELKGQDQLGPGEECEAVIRFLDAPGLKEQLVPGKVWRIQEGLKLVGIAEMIRLEK